ncbi:SGNH/GDSL hydrolase family protein [Actinoplanes sp. N902-109]|uniref:SGNH/GDSL hydrolase family protein n=1 Tax=Actinoplanes sp. (strain N902-109) TaxID=649831 RepID=UPI00032962D8|nr:SGNH/GDSL hydrolase family protein [Actinoplanes sp. N902-109]AGL13665.1 G-D-S-L family lipolytic protein [Actinoplanes sp. N902-109]
MGILVKVMTGVLSVGVVVGLGLPRTASAPAVAAAPEAPAAAPQITTQGLAPIRVMPIGDSITRGTGSPTRSSYRMALAERLRKGGLQINYVGSQSDGTGSDISHEGHGGWTIDQLSEQATGWLTAWRPDVVLVHAGTNNITKGDGPYTTARKLSAFVDQIRAARPDAHIFVAQIVTSRVPREAAQDRVYNKLIPTLMAAKHDAGITVVDQSSVGGIDLHDLHHPNDFGYSKMAWNWYTAMAPSYGVTGDTGPNPYRASRTYRCLASKVVIDGEEHHRTECRTWFLRPTTLRISGVNRSVRVWQTLRETKQTYRVRVQGKPATRTRTIRRWTGPGNLLNV